MDYQCWFVHPNEVLVNCNAKPGDSLILTKAIGTGILNPAQGGPDWYRYL